MKTIKAILLLLITYSVLISCVATNGGGCGKYGEQIYDDTRCESNFQCFGKNQKATYKYELQR